MKSTGPAQKALTTYVAYEDGEEEEDLATQVVDLITNLMHLVEAEGGDALAAIDQAVDEFNTETADT